jgi:hypothetical protein
MPSTECEYERVADAIRAYEASHPGSRIESDIVYARLGEPRHSYPQECVVAEWDASPGGVTYSDTGVVFDLGNRN